MYLTQNLCLEYWIEGIEIEVQCIRITESPPNRRKNMIYITDDSVQRGIYAVLNETS